MIKRLILFTVLITCYAYANDPYDWIEDLPNPWEIEGKEFEYYLSEFHAKYPTFNSRLKGFNLWRVGTPYGLYCLGEENEKDQDPIIRYDSSDCTVHVLTTLAYVKSQTAREARKNMIDIHYKLNEKNKKVPSYDSRWHFTSDRILNHPMMLDITSSLIDSSKIENVIVELNKKNNGELFLDIGWSSKENIGFIPSRLLDEVVLSKLPSVCGVAFVKKDYFKLGIVIAHEGYLIDRLDLIHASSEFGETVNINFLDYLKKDKKYRFDGVIFFEVLPNN